MVVLCAGVARAEGPLPIKVSENGRYLVHSDGTPFFYLGDTAWELFHRLNREEAERYLVNRAEKGFTVIQAVIASELDGIATGNAYGDTPFHDLDPSRPNENFFAHVDWIVKRAAAHGLYMALLPSWGNWVGTATAEQGLSNFFHEGNARAYGRFLADRYKAKPVIWVLGGDCLPAGGMAAWDEMAAGIRTAVGNDQLITYHPSIGYDTDLHGKTWLDFNMHQSAHASDTMNYDAIARDYALKPAKPCMDAEPAYEFPPDAMPVGIEVGEVQIRRLAYWGLFAGAHGHSYGTHPIWQMYDVGREPLWHVVTPWHQALDLPGVKQLVYVKRLMLSRPFLTRIPDQSVILSENPGGIEHIRATRDGSPGANNATYLMVYFPKHNRATINTALVAGESLQVTWYNPRNGEASKVGEMPNKGTMGLEPPTNAEGEDWVLIVDDGRKGYCVP
ncbi:MAG: glycoside hydrolase family 140 protein [Candidatus Hydrogenedentes bacterium]|nr:glycoside hydrolase family 140 protein [Candidatus Hydrogenedentota bacterium]